MTRHDRRNFAGAFVALFALEEDAKAFAVEEACSKPGRANYYVTRQPVR